MKKVWMKSYAYGFVAVALALGTPLFGNAQSSVPVEIQIEHLNHCTDLLNQGNQLSEGDLAIKQMIDYKDGTLTFGSEELKTETLRKVAALQRENSTEDLEALKRILTTQLLKADRDFDSECADTDRNKSDRSSRLDEIASLLTDLDQAEDAIPVLRRCMTLDADFAPCSASMGTAFQALGRKSEAILAFKRTIEIGAFNERNAKSIEFARQMLAILEREDEASKEAPVNEEAPPAQHAFGTGFFVSGDGEIITNNHVVAGCRNLTVQGGLPVQVISRDPSSDLALVKANLKPDHIAVFRSGPAPKVGDSVVIFGFPLPGVLSSEGNASTGIISATTGLQNDIRFVQISAPVQPGNSGGPMFDTSGHVIGVVVSKLDAVRVAQITGDVPQNVNFAVHWSEVRALLDEQGLQYRKLPSQQPISTRAIAKVGADISVMLDCTQ
jgi:S1-C subfamily serine protease